MVRSNIVALSTTPDRSVVRGGGVGVKGRYSTAEIGFSSRSSKVELYLRDFKSIPALSTDAFSYNYLN